MAPRHVVIDPDFERNLFHTEEVRAVLQDRADATAARAAELAPDDPDTGGEDLHSTIVGEVGLAVIPVGRGLSSLGYIGRVIALNFKAPFFEEGTIKQPPRPFLRPAAEAEVGPIEASPIAENR